MERPAFFELLLSELIILANSAKKIISFLTPITKRSSSLKGSVVFGWSHLLQLKRGVCLLLFCMVLLSSATSFAQLAVPFTSRLSGGHVKVKGDVVLIGNTVITGKGLSLPYNGSGNNNSYEGVYINVASGGDPSIFSSSTADLDINNSCKNILYAGLYWASIYPMEIGTNSGQQFVGTPRYNDWNQVKFKLPTGGFIDLVADNNPDPVGQEDDIIFDGYDPVNINNSFKDSPIICYKNVTSLLQGLADADGTYTVANLRATRGKRNGGCAGGWTLVVIYESPTMPSKFISVFDGYAGVQGSVPAVDIPVSGFQTLPAPSPVFAKIGVSALEGDYGIKNDRFQFKASTSGSYTNISDARNPSNNFFNSTISNEGSYLSNRNPNSRNNLGYDIDNVIIPNPGNGVLPNDATAGTLRLTSTGDGYGAFVTSFAVDIIEPKILLTKIVEDKNGNDIGGANVTLGDQLNYVIGFQNIGNDDATKLTIRDVLPINVIFNYPSDLDILPPGVMVQSYNPVTREIVFKIDDSVVEIDDPVLEIRFKVSVVPSCNMLSDACSNSIDNQAYATYEGVFNPNFTISDDPSINSNSGCVFTPKATNFLVGVDDCLYTQTEVLCGDSVVLTAANGYSTYSWSTDPSGSPVIGTTQSITVNNTGTYYVHNTAVAPCLSINQEITVVPFGNTVSNPAIPFADEVVTCPNDGKALPNIFLCGANAERVMQTGISDASSIIWEKLDEGSCTAVADTDCANESTSCTWNQVGTGPDYTANASGQYRITLNYAGGCFNRYYFNVYQNLLNPTVTTTDIICNTPGKITVGGVPGGYEYSLDGSTYQASNIFSIATQNIYTVYIRQAGVTSNPCIFTVPNVQIRARNFTVSTVITPPLCNGGKGKVKIAANDVRPQYSYAIYSGATLVNSVGPIAQSDYTFADLNSGTYTINVTTEDGCSYTGDIDITEPALLTATAAITKPLTCTDGEITVYPVGGTPPYFYFVNSTTDFETVPEIVVTTAGKYNITVFDSNNCSTTTSITVDDNPAPVYTIDKTDILCYSDNSGDIQFNVSNANGYTLEYSIDNGVTYSSNPVFSNLAPGNYQAVIKYTLGVSECFTTPEEIIIYQPDTALTASSGVSELAGCGPSGEGKVRITNPQGGTPPYEYSFDNQATWVTTNESNVLPGTYTLYIKDANGCIYAMPSITLDPEPVAPTIDVSDPDFNCDGTAGATVTVTNPGSSSFNYNYLLDGVANTNTADPKTFLDVPTGSHTVSVEYVLSSVPTYSNLLYETFGYGEDTSSPGINPTYYCFERQVAATQCKGNPAINDGDYSVTAHIVHPFGAWVQPVDHTPATVPVTPKGRFLVVNIGATIPKTEILYEKQINDIIPNQPINVEFFAMNLLKSGNTQYDPDLVVALVDGSGTEISSFSTGNIPKTETWENYPKTPMTLDPGSNTSLKFIVRSNVQQTSGNDVAIDDISVFQLPKSCVTQVDFPFIVDSGKAFASSTTGSTNVTCNGSSDGTITIAAQNFDPASGFEYSIDNGTTWTTQMTSPYTITGLAAGTYDVIVRYDTCSFPFTQTITAPAPLGVSVYGTPITCLAGSTVTATATGGTTAYSYELLDTATLTLVANFPSNGILTDVAAGDYTVRVTDANGCTATDTINLVNSAPPTASIALTSDYCYDATNGATLEVTASGGVTPYEYNINGGSFGSSNVFANLTPGTYDIIVRDAYGCTVALPTETIEPQVTVNTTLTKELDCTASPDATITGTITGGYSPFSYAVSINGAAYSSLGATGSPFFYTTPTDGTYQFQITDAKGCQSVSNVITIAPKTNPVVTASSKTDVSCNGASDGSVQLLGSGGSGSYTYSDDNVTFTGTSLFTGLAAGTYTYYIKDSKNCTSSVSVTITEPTVLSTTASVTTPLSCAADNTKQSAEITIAVPSTGTAPYQYSFDGGANFSSTNTLTVNDNGGDQTFSYAVKDANGCTTAAQNIIITALDPPTDLAFSSTAVTCSATTSTVDLTATNGVGTLEYETIAPSPIIRAKQTSNSFVGLTPGTYVFRVTDANGCYYTESYTIAPVTPIAISGAKLSDVLCHGDNTGAIQYTVTGYSGNYTPVLTSGAGTLSPSVSTSSSTIDLTDLVAGSYTLEVTDDITGCTATSTIIIDEPANAPSIASTTSTHVYCTEDKSQITVTATGGTPSYTYAAVVTGAPAPVVYDGSNVITVDTNSAADLVWDVYVKDANGCIAMNTVTIVADPLPTVTTPALASNQCSASSGFTFTATGTSGVPPYQYSINGGASYQSSATFTVNTPGSYTVTIKDANGCTNTSPTPTVVYAPLTTVAAITKELDCSVSPDAEITVTISGGLGDYTYTVQKGAGPASAPSAPFSGPTFTYSVALADVDAYTFVITDANGCASTSTIAVDPITNPVVTASSKTDVSCNGASDGSVQLLGSGGSGSYTYSDDNVTFTGTSLFTGLAAGTYTYYIKDSKNCTSSVPVTITEPTVLSTTASVTTPLSCAADNTKQSAEITIAVPSTGTAPYQYSFDGGANFSSTNTLTVNDNGGDQTFSYAVKDANGCTTAAQNIIITALDPPMDLAFSSTAVTCSATTSTVDLTATNGVGTLEYETIAPSPIIRAKQTSNSFVGLTPGTYVFRVTDANGCYYTESYTIAPVTPIAISGAKLSDVLCHGDNTGAIQYTVTGYSGNYTPVLTSGAGTLSPSVSTSSSTIDLTDLVAGSYTLEVTDDITGCTATSTIIIDEPANAPSIASTTSTHVYCTEDNSQITVTATGGTPSYTYAAVVTGAPAPVLYDSSNVITVDTNSAADLVWDVYVKDTNGCIAMNTVTIVADPLPTVTTPALASNQCSASSGFTFTATGTSGVPPYQYSINGGSSYQASATFTVNTPGSYTVTIKDANGCTNTSPTPTVVYAPLDTSAILTKDITCSPAPSEASIDVTVSGGNGSYSYKVKIGAGAYGALTPIVGPSFTYTAPAADTYQFEITDGNGCTKETNVITTHTTVNPDITNVTETQSISCNGEETAAIDITIDNTKGLAPFVFNVYNNTTSHNYGTQTSGLAPGDYTIRVTDAKGCIDTFPITISQPTPIIVTDHTEPVTCGGGGVSKGAVVIDGVTGGTAPYTYYVSSTTNGYSDFEVNPTGSTSTTFNSVDFGIYEILVVDANGCSVLHQNRTVASPVNDLDITVTSPPADCSSGGSATVKAEATIPGVGPYFFAIYTGSGMVYPNPIGAWLPEDAPLSRQTTFLNLIPGASYTFIVYDLSSDCYYYKTSTIPIPTNSLLTASALSSNNVTCKGSNDGNVSFDILDGYGVPTDVTFEIYDSLSLATTGISGSGTVPASGTLTVSNLGPLPPGNYVVVITEAAGATNAGCSIVTSAVNITQSANLLSVSASVSKNENCNELGVISATAQDGTGPYTYQLLLTSDPAPTAASAGWAATNTFNAVAANYTVYVKDAYGCIQSDTVNLTKDTEPTIDPIPSQCFDGSPINITVVEGTGTAIAPLTYSIGGAYQASANFTISAAGTYDIFIKDGNGCIVTDTYVVESPLLLDADMAQDLTCSVDATINLTPSGGTGTYTTYEVSTDSGATYTVIGGPSYTASVDGTYQFRVTDDQGCQAESSTIIVTPKTVPTLTKVQTNVSCNGGSNGSIVVTAADGIATYQYSKDNGATFQASNVFNNLSAGTYDIVVRDSKNCDSAPTTVTITEPVTLAGTGDLTQGLTCGSGNATQAGVVTISTTVGTGTGPYSYSFDGGANYTSTNTYSTFTSGTVSAYIKDANGCTFGPIDVPVPALDPPTDLTFTSPAVTCIATTTDVTLTATNGVGPLSYAILSPASETGNVSGASSGVFTGLAPDTYMFEVTDDNGCYYQESYTVDPVTNITVSGALVNDVSCNGGSNGAVGFTVSNFAGTYSYIIDGNPAVTGQSLAKINLTGLAAGNHTIDVTDETTGCTDTATILVSEPTALTLAETSNIKANCNFGAQVSVTAGGGTPNYTYAFVQNGVGPIATDYTSSNSAVLDPVTNTDWDVWVMDANGCTTQIDVTIATDPLPTIAPIAAQCFDGTPINITVVEGTGTAIAPLTYSIGGAYQASANFTISAAGTYDIFIKDGNGCIVTDTYVVEPPLLLDADMAQDLTCSVDATINLTPSGGTGTYTTYEVSTDSGATYTVIGGPSYTASVDGTYQFRVTDDQGCQAESSTIIVTPKTVPTLTKVQTNVSCNGGSNGSIVVTAADGIATYQYSKDNGATFQASNVFNNLSAGTYDIVVRDSKNCDSAPTTVTITEPVTLAGTGDLTQGLTCGSGNATQAGVVTISTTVGTGTGPYSYSFDGGANYTSTNTYSTFTSGTVSAYIKDANGCTFGPIDVPVPALDPPTDLTFTSPAVTCIATTTDVTLTATNGVGPLSYAILSPASETGNVSGASSGVFTGLAPDTYMFEVTDDNGCYYQESYTVDPVTNITVSGALVNDVSCNGGSNGAVGFTVSNFAGTYSYIIDGNPAVTGQSLAKINLTGLAAGNHTIDVTDETTGCTDTATILVSEPTALTLAETSNIKANCNFGAQVSVTAGGGTPNYTYAFVQNGVGPIATDYTSSNSAVLDPVTNTDWDVWVMDANGCTTQIDIVIDTDPLPSVTVPVLADNQCNITGDPYAFTITGSTGVGTLTYSIGTGFQSSGTFTGLTPGNYFVTVKDGNGCTNISSTSVTVYPALNISTSITTLPSCSEGDGVITVTGSGGSGNYAYSINPSASITQTGNVFSGLSSATNYTVTIEDTTTLCTKDVIVNLPTATPVDYTVTSSDVSCHGGSDGGITVNLPVSNDNPIYTYEITAPITVAAQTSPSFSGLAAGTYTVLVTSGRGCTFSKDITVDEPNAIAVSAPIVVDYACSTGRNTTNFATITVNTVAGGSGTYTNYEFIKGGTVVQFSNNNVYTESDLSGGTYTINVYDDNGCSGTTTATIAPYIELDKIIVNIDNAITCTNDEDITVSVSSNGGPPTDLEYTVEDIVGAVTGGVYSQTNATGIFTGLTIGNYVITVTNLDTGCSLQKVHYVSNPNTFDLTIDSVVDVTCFNDSDGSVNVTFIDRVPTPTDEAGPFGYSVVDALGNPVTSGTSASAGPVSITNLAAGTYTITAILTNAPYCSVSKNFTITAPTAALAISETHTEITCVSGNNDGSISATATGGWPGGYEYQLELTSGAIISPFSNVSNFNGLTAGDYLVSVKDSRGCIASTNVVLVIPTPISATVTPSPSLLSCFGDTNATITVSGVGGGQGSNYTYTLNMTSPKVTSSGPQTNPIFTGLGAGTYTVDITDGYNCTFTSSDITITEPAQVRSSLVKTTSQTCLTGTTLTLSATGGTGLYEYSDTASFTPVLGSFALSTTINVSPGTYVYYVRDANGCYADVSNQIKIDPLPPLKVDVDATNAFINCAGDNTGVIVATAQGGLGSYVYTLQDNLGNPIAGAVQNSPGVFTNLFAGNYQVQVDSGDCNTVSSVISITEPASPLTESHTAFDVTCNGSDNGVLEINASGGTGIIKYAISPQMNQFFETSTFDNLAPGTYDAIVQDELGCYITFNFTISEPNPLMVDIVPGSLIPEVCTGDMDGEFSVDISGGTAPYSVALDDINGVYTTGSPTQTQFDFTGLQGGDHVVYVKDGQGCESEWNITFPESVIINPETIVDYGCVNNASSNTVTVTVDASITNPSDMDYSLDGGTYQASNVFTNVAPGTHVIDARHTNGCIKSTAPFVVDQIDPLAMSIDDSQINQIIVTAAGGSGIYEYAFNGDSNGSSNTFVIYKSGDYTISVTDSNGCIVEETRYFEYIDICVPNYFTPNGDGVSDTWAPGCTITYKDLEFSIFDRYGRKVATYHLGEKWDGTYKGSPLPTGDYWYILKLNNKNDDRKFVGHFNLYR